MDVDRQLVEACRGGDSEAYAELAKRYSRSVFAACLGTLGNVQDAEDVSQEALIKGLACIGGLRDGAQFGPWLLKVARNLCLDHARRKKRGLEIAALQGGDRRPLADEYADLREAIARLSEKYRLPLMLYYFDGRSTESVARALEISTDGALTRLSRARKKLRKLIDSEEVPHE